MLFIVGSLCITGFPAIRFKFNGNVKNLSDFSLFFQFSFLNWDISSWIVEHWRSLAVPYQLCTAGFRPSHKKRNLKNLLSHSTSFGCELRQWLKYFWQKPSTLKAIHKIDLYKHFFTLRLFDACEQQNKKEKINKIVLHIKWYSSRCDTFKGSGDWLMHQRVVRRIE